MLGNMGLLALVSLILLCCTGICHATGGLNGLPILNGPVAIYPHVIGSKTRLGDFVHPGIWHTHDDLERIRLGVQNQTEPYYTAYQNFSQNEYSQAGVGSLDDISQLS